MMNYIDGVSLEEWMIELKAYQRNSISILIKDFGEEEAMLRWLSAQGPRDNVPFGGGLDHREPKLFLEKVKSEFKKFICGHPDYEEERNKLRQETSAIKSILIPTISTAIGASLGHSATILIPVVVILLGVSGRVGLRAYCMQNEVEEPRQ